MSEFSIMPFYVGDYLADTSHLSTEEHGAYILLLLHYWKKRQGPKNDPKRLAKITLLSAKKWRNFSPTILEFFQIKDDRLIHPRMERELTIAAEKHNRRVDAGQKGGQQRSSNALAKLKHSSSNGVARAGVSDSDSLKEPLPQQAGDSGEEEKPKNSRAHGTNPRALGTNPRTNVIRQEEEAREDHRIQRQVDDAWAEANAAPADEALDAIEKMKVLAGAGERPETDEPPTITEDDIPW